MEALTYEWTPAISVGVSIIDLQHQEIFAQVNALARRDRETLNETDLLHAISFLQDYVRDHFAQEERYMTSFEYPERASHVAEHARFLAEYKTLMKTFRAAGPTESVARHVQRLVGDWLLNHILSTDQKLGRFLADHL